MRRALEMETSGESGGTIADAERAEVMPENCAKTGAAEKAVSASITTPRGRSVMVGTSRLKMAKTLGKILLPGPDFGPCACAGSLGRCVFPGCGDVCVV